MGKFKVGDLIQNRRFGRIRRIVKTTEDGAYCPIVGGTDNPGIYVKELTHVQLNNYRILLTFKNYLDEI